MFLTCKNKNKKQKKKKIILKLKKYIIYFKILIRNIFLTMKIFIVNYFI